MIFFIRCTSIAANLVVVAFLGCLIFNQTKTLLWVHHLNQFWFFLAVIALIALTAALAEYSERKKPKSGGVPTPGDASSLQPSDR